MPLPNPNYIAMFPLQEQIWDKDLNVPLAAGYILFFEDEARTIPKNVFVQTQTPGPTYSYTNIGSTVTLSSIGTTQYLGTDTTIFLYPFDANGAPELYYIEVFSSTNVLQFTRSGWPPATMSSGGGSSTLTQSGNIISNPQFAEVLFNPSGTTFTVSGTATTDIAPDWTINTTGSGTFTVQQIAITDALAPGEPSYALDIISASVDSIILSQRITKSPRILENTFASGTFIIEAISPTVTTPVTMNYVPSSGTLVPIVIGNATAGGFALVSGTTIAVIPQTNTNPPGNTGYVDVQFVIAPGAHIQISAIQLVSVATAATIASYVQESVPRQIDHLFHYYKSGIDFKPIKSYLVGWDFPLNPAQLPWVSSYGTIPAQSLGSNTGYYAWDQTILFQTVTSGITASSSAIPALQLESATTTTQMALIQYLDADKASEIVLDSFLNGLSVNVRCGSTVAQNLTISLWWCSNSTLPTLPTTFINTVDSNGHPNSVASGWTEILRDNLGITSFTTNSTITDYGFSGWKTAAVTDSQTTNFFAIVVGTNAVLSGNVFQIVSISLVPGSVPTIPATQTMDEVLRECSRYYQKSFATNISPASNSGYTNSVAFIQAVGTGTVGTLGPLVSFPVEMRVTPTVNLYNPAGSGTQIFDATAGSAWSSSKPAGTGQNTQNQGTKGFITSGTTPAGSSAGDISYVHWTATSQLGIV